MSEVAMQFPLTVTQAAAILGMSVKTVSTLIEEGKLEAGGRGVGKRRNHWRIEPSAIEKYQRQERDSRIQAINQRAYAVAKAFRHVHSTRRLAGAGGQGR